MAKATPEERWLDSLYLDGSCWRSKFHILHNGYAQFRVGNQRRMLVHLFAYTTFVGPIPEGMQVDHVKARGCRFRDCSNPAHLEAVTPRVNTLRSDSPLAANARKTHCPKGHPYDLLNTRVDPKGKRNCRTCDRARLAQRRRAQAAVRVPKPRVKTPPLTHCLRGHPYDAANTYWHGGHYYCRACQRESKRRQAKRGQ